MRQPGAEVCSGTLSSRGRNSLLIVILQLLRSYVDSVVESQIHKICHPDSQDALLRSLERGDLLTTLHAGLFRKLR